MTKNLTLGTAKIAQTDNGFVLTYMSQGNFTVCERTYANEQAAREFCAERRLRVL